MLVNRGQNQRTNLMGRQQVYRHPALDLREQVVCYFFARTTTACIANPLAGMISSGEKGKLDKGLDLLF